MEIFYNVTIKNFKGVENITLRYHIHSNIKPHMQDVTKVNCVGNYRKMSVLQVNPG